jgi:starch synthase
MSDRKLVGARLLKGRLPDSDVPVWFIDQPQYFDREALYGTSHGDYPDNAERFAFFCRAAMQAIARIGWTVDIVHCNDWQTGLVPAMTRALPVSHPWISRAASIITIHNLAYQGQFPAYDFQWVGLDWSHFNPDEFEFYGHLNFLKTAIVTADAITTVSPKYAEEIQTPLHGCGLDGVLSARADRVFGIINGIDRNTWDPRRDTKLASNYGVQDWHRGKLENKRSIQREFGLEQSDDLPLIGLVGRLAEQKGWDLILPVLRWHLSEDRPTQWIVLGSGDPRYEHPLMELREQYPEKFALHIGFSDELAHRIEAGADLFVMPSLYEPCGLNQLYSLRYGSVPIVTNTGGLANSVVNCNSETLEDETATGFYVPETAPQALDAAIGRALRLRHHAPEHWEKMVRTGMSQDWSWRKSATQYIELYEKTAAIKRTSQKNGRW